MSACAIYANYRRGDNHRVQCVCGWVSAAHPSLLQARGEYRAHAAATPRPLPDTSWLRFDDWGVTGLGRHRTVDTDGIER